jgi:hypothetical protein
MSSWSTPPSFSHKPELERVRRLIAAMHEKKDTIIKAQTDYHPRFNLVFSCS